MNLMPLHMPRLGPLPVFIALLCACAAPPAAKDFNTPLAPSSPALLRVLDKNEWPAVRSGWRDREELLPALEASIRWTSRRQSEAFFPIEGIGHAQALASLERFYKLLTESTSAEEFERTFKAEFAAYKSAGWDGRGGGVLFTGYYTPILDGRLASSPEFPEPLYALPEDLVKGSGGTILGRRTATGIENYPTRRTIEASGSLAGRGLELVWLASPLDAFIAHVNGSAFVRLENGELARFGYAGNNGHDYTSLARELVAAGELAADESNLAAIRAWARRHPERVTSFLERNDRFVFFTTIEGNPRGSLNLEVTAGHSLATDKTIFPRGALVFCDARGKGGDGPAQFMLDQDTGGAIRTAGRADIYFGFGDTAEARAGALKAEGQLYYFFLDV
ncbi:MAG: MltA domain-containing protein [bacterium]|jgi:membrane-bound lytic murein transglycosylase A